MNLTLGILVTVAAYVAARFINRRWPSPLTTVALVSTLIVAETLSIARVPLQAYHPARETLSSFLAPATVALAVPLYRNRAVLGKNLFAALAGLFAGASTTALAALAGSFALHLPKDVSGALAIKSVTAAVAAELATSMHIDAALVVVIVIATGMFGAACGPWLLDRANVRDPVARGVAIGTISHGIGTARIAAENPCSGAVAGSAMSVTAAVVSVATALFFR